MKCKIVFRGLKCYNEIGNSEICKINQICKEHAKEFKLLFGGD